MLAFAPLDAATGVAHALLATVASGLAPVGGATTAIVVLTLATRVLLSPLGRAQVRAQRTRAALAPRVEGLRRRHRDDPARLQTELIALYRAEGTGPFAGCLPALVQLPFFTVLYRVFTAHGTAGLPGYRLLGVPLDQHWGAVLAHAPWSGASAVFTGLLALLGLLAWWSGHRAARAAGSGSGAGAPGWLVRVMPFGTVLVGAVVPLAAGVYLLTTTAYTIAEGLVLRRGAPGPEAAVH